MSGIQTAITLYTLVMASLMITGGKLGQILGRKRAFAIGCVIYGCGSLTTALAKSLPVLIFGWSFLEGVGAALILPAIVALVASNFPQVERPKAYGLVASAGAIAVAAGPLIGGLFTTYLSWRWVFVGEVVLVLAILLLTRRMADTPAEAGARLDLVGTALSAAGLGLVVFGILRSGSWGVVQPKSGAPTWLGLSPVAVVDPRGRSRARGCSWGGRPTSWPGARRPSSIPAMLKNRVLRSGLTAFFFQYLLQAGLFFVVPLFLSVALGLSAIATGVRLLPTFGHPPAGGRGHPEALPPCLTPTGRPVGISRPVRRHRHHDGPARRPERGPKSSPGPCCWPGSGIGALASQLGSVTVSSVPDEQSGEVGGVQNTMTNLGASIGTAVAGAVLISALSTSFFTGIQNNPAVPAECGDQGQTELSSGVPFVSDAQLKVALEKADVPTATAEAVTQENTDARIGGLRSALAVLAVVGLLAIFFSRRLPVEQPSTSGSATDVRLTVMARDCLAGC